MPAHVRRCPLCRRPYGRRNRCYYCTGTARVRAVQKCEWCSKPFEVWPSQLYSVSGGGTFCSNECKYAARRGRERVRGSRYVRPDGYVAVKVGVRQWELEHRLVMQQHLGRALRTDEHVHHKNGDRQDNRLANLAVLAATDHVALHGADWRDRRVNQVTVNCDHCGQPYTRKASRAAASRYCSQRCYHEARRRHA